MPTSHKPPKAAPTEQPQPDVVETVTVAAAPGADERPGIDSMFPPAGYVVPASGAVAASVGVSRSAAGIPLGRVEWYVDGALVGTDKGPRDAATWNVSRSLPIPIGDHEIQVWLWNLTGPGRNHRIRTVTRPDLVDRAPPAFQIVAPANNTRLPVGKVAVYGWAQDPSSVVAAEWSLDGGAYQAIPCTPDPQIKNQVSWRFEFDLAAGPHTVALRFRDGKGNTTPATAASAITLTGVAAFHPFDDLMSLRAYLDDLLGYAATHVKIDWQTQRGPRRTARFLSGPAGRRAHLCGRARGRRRKALAHVRAATARDTADAASEADYRQAAYRALLNQAGVSYEEIRLARGADDAKRDALAARLGIASVHLDDLLLRLPDVTEAALERLFGLADTTRDPAIQAADALLLTWRRDYLPTLWQQQDAEALSEPDAATVIVDPDLIGPDDLQQAAPGDPAYDLWQTRTNALASILGAFKQKRAGQPDQPLSAFEAIVADGLGQPAAILLELDARQKAGKDITSKDIV